MNNNLALEAFELFVETMPLETMSPDHPMFNELYEKECKIFELFGRMTDDDKVAYRKAVQAVKIHQVK